MPITSEINSDLEFINIMEGALMTLVRKDFASLKKFFNWFLDHLSDDAETKPSHDDPAIRFTCPALQSIFNKFLNCDFSQNAPKVDDRGITMISAWSQNTPI